ncbi:MAG: hypothetical protein ACK5LT_12500 [Lachnospirales bacterium]
MKDYFELTFLDNVNEDYELKISRPGKDAIALNIAAVMEELLTIGILRNRVDVPSIKVSATLNETVIENVTLA